jgi:uncharacterized protein
VTSGGSERPVEIPSGDLRLEGRLSLPEAPRGALVVCHPHPQYGGTMDVPVVLAVASCLRREGFATLRFNFRGVGRSEGSYGDLEGEVEDGLAALAFLARESGRSPLDVAGYSFGAIVALRAAAAAGAVRRVVAISPPTKHYPVAFLSGIATPILAISGDRDEYGTAADAERALRAAGAAARIVTLAGADHFLYGHEDRIADEAARFLVAETEDGS